MQILLKFFFSFLQCMQIMGNSKARAVYEANVPEGFRRPQTDSQLDVFIRAKYEKKKYIAREWVPTKAPELPEGWTALIEAEKQKKDIRSIVLPSHTKDSKEEIVKRFCIYILVIIRISSISRNFWKKCMHACTNVYYFQKCYLFY